MLSKRCYIKLSAVLCGVVKPLLLGRAAISLEKPLHHVLLVVHHTRWSHHVTDFRLPWLIRYPHLLIQSVEASTLHQPQILDEVLLLGLNTAPVAHVPEGKVQIVA